MLVVLAVLLPRVRLSRPSRVAAYLLLAVWALLGAVGLVRAFYHFTTDTIGGAAVAIACVCGTAIVIDSLAGRWARTASARDPLLDPNRGVLRV
jgi:membrane-associated phospholipid phosphatase